MRLLKNDENIHELLFSARYDLQECWLVIYDVVITFVSYCFASDKNDKNVALFVVHVRKHFRLVFYDVAIVNNRYLRPH